MGGAGRRRVRSQRWAWRVGRCPHRMCFMHAPSMHASSMHALPMHASSMHAPQPLARAPSRAEDIRLLAAGAYLFFRNSRVAVSAVATSGLCFACIACGGWVS
jgi:hypothetical protein